MHAPSPLSEMGEAALAYASKGWPVFPCNHLLDIPPDPERGIMGGKRCKKPLTPHGFMDATTDPIQIATWWRRWPNALIGTPAGSKTGVWVLDLDLDLEKGKDGLTDLANLEREHGPVPETLTVRTPRGGQHRYFPRDATRPIRNSTGRLAKGIDTRGEGGYVILPPSKRADGATYQWVVPWEQAPFVAAPDWIYDLIRSKPNEPDPDPTDKDEDKEDEEGPDEDPEDAERSGASMDIRGRAAAQVALKGCFDELAATPDGKRNHKLNALAYRLGRMVARGWIDRRDIEKRLLEAAYANNLVLDESERAAMATIQSGLRAGIKNPHPDLKDRRHTGPSGDPKQTRTLPGPDGRPIVRLVPGEESRVETETEGAILASGQPVFIRGNVMVRPAIDTKASASKGKTTTVIRLSRMTRASMLRLLSEIMWFEEFNKKQKAWVRIKAPVDVRDMLLDRDGYWKLPKIVGTTTIPILRPDGSLFSVPGYDPTTRLYYTPDENLKLPSINEAPTREEALTALTYLTDLLVEFPFKTEIDWAVALSALITPIVRAAIDNAPMHAIRAHTAGTGKSFLIDLISLIVTGRPCPVMAIGKTEEETEKRLVSWVHDGVPIIAIDNVDGELSGDFLCQLLTAFIVKPRLLGGNEAPDYECKMTIVANGNNLTLVGGLASRRALLCSLDARVENPEKRPFKFDPKSRIMNNRGKYIAAIVTIVRAYLAAGEPIICDPLASYEDWIRMVRAPLMWLGLPDPVESMEIAREEDPELNAIREVFAHWQAILGLNSAHTTNQITEKACEQGVWPDDNFRYPEFRDALLRIAGQGGAISTKRLGKWLRAINGRIVGSLRLNIHANMAHGGVRQFYLEKISS